MWTILILSAVAITLIVAEFIVPGGVLGVVDHVAVAGSGSAAAQELHRIDAAFARADIESHGFEFTGELDVLRNPDDQLATSVFDESVSGKTDRFVYEPGG